MSSQVRLMRDVMVDGVVEVVGPEIETVSPTVPARSRLKLLLFSLDATAVVVAWSLWATSSRFGPGATGPGELRTVVLATVVTLSALAAMHLYRTRVCAVHAVEIVAIGRAVLLSAVIVKALEGAIDAAMPIEDLASGALTSFVALLVARWVFRSWLAFRRRRGHHLRPVVVVGTNEEGRALVAMLGRNPEAGFRVVGLLGGHHGVANNGTVPWLGPAERCAQVVKELGANGAFLAASALTPTQLNDGVRELMANGSHVHLSSSLRGISARRIRLQPLSREMMFYLEPARLHRWQAQVKRTIDVGLAAFGLVLTAPVLLVTAVIIRLQDGGPVLFRQERVGRDGTTFTLLKLRTMVIDAEAQLPSLHDRNERDGILFKLEADPRVTRFGKVLRTLSIDELPQLFNVLRGEMSLVGPRPALPSEVANFDERLQGRHQVTPGVTGLWQVEARDVPDLGAYARLDLFYVENWSVALDLAIILSTISAVLGRAGRILLRKEHTS